VDVAFNAGPQAHSVYKELLAHPPEGVRYAVHSMDWRAPLWGSPLRDALYWKMRGARRRLFGLPEAAAVPDWGMPIHSAQALLKTRRPWVVDYEYPTFFTGFDAERLPRPSVQRRIARILAGGCKALLPWTEAAADATRKLVPAAADRMRVVRPAMAPRERAVPEDPDAPLVLFVARFFHRKGGPEAIEAFARARRASNPRARMLVVSTAPPEYAARYKDQGVEFLPAGQPREKVLEHYRRASLFVLPTKIDTFGMVFLEAFSHGIPVVASDTFAVDELVAHGEDGLVVPGYEKRWFQADDTPTPGLWRWEWLQKAHGEEEKERVTARLAEALGPLLADAKRLQRMSERAYAKVTHGAFSVGERNRRLLAVYREAFGGP
jgi:glycosyltransferase involved in cell wall biosynthesis